MREIKFRAFCKKDNIISPVIKINFDSPNYNVMLLRPTKIAPENWTVRMFDEIELMQFTGFKAIDKKTNLDEDVYEGDIFRQTDETDNGDEITYHVVMWLNERGAFYMIPCDHYCVIRDNGIPKEKEFNWLLDDAALYDFSFDVKLTKVGNVYENPELL